jgi:hypothetical protein
MTFAGTAGILPLPTASDAQAIGSATHEFSDIYLADAATIELGADQDVTITHVADAGILMELDDYISFGDSAVFIESDDDSYLDLDADGGVRLNTPAITIQDSATLTFDESAANPNDADIVLSATDGVLTFAAANGVYNEDLTMDLDAVEDGVNFKSSTGIAKWRWLTAVNNGDPVYAFGSAAGDSMQFQVDLGAADQELQSVTFQTNTTDLDADDGFFAFNVDGANTKLRIDDAGVDVTGVLTTSTNFVIGDAGTIGSASDTDAIAIGATGIVSFTQPIFTNGGVATLTPISDDCDNFATNFTGANLYGGTFIANATGTCQLPVMGVGMNFTIITLGAIQVIIDTNVADGYLADGTTGVEGANITNLSTAGDIAVVQYYTADDWLITTNGWTPE